MRKSTLFTDKSISIDEAFAAITEDGATIIFDASNNNEPEGNGFYFEISEERELFNKIMYFEYSEITLSIK
jgi:hypothetical protein